MTIQKIKIGDMTILGTKDDFRESERELLDLNFDKRRERERALNRRHRALNPVATLRNRYDRMKSYWTDKGTDFRVTFQDYCRLWYTAPKIYDPEQQKTVSAVQYSDRKGKIRATKLNPTVRRLDTDNLVLKLGSKLYHGPLGSS